MPSFPNRCQHLKINGTQCGSPALRRNRFCFFHKRFQDEHIRLSADRARHGVVTFILPVLEDANSVQIALMQVMRLLVSQQIDHKTASLLLYALQTASTNLRLTRFEPLTNEVVLDVRDVANTPLDENIWEDEDFEEEEDEAQTTADRAIAELETARKKRIEHAKWMRWVEMQYPDPRNANPTPAVTTTGSALMKNANLATPTRPPSDLPLPNLKKPASSMKPEEIRAEITAMVRKQFPASTGKSAPDRSPGSGEQ